MANVDRKFPLDSLGEDVESDSRHELALQLLSETLRRGMQQAAGKSAQLSPQQERLIRRAMKNCPLDVLGKMTDKKS